MVLGLAAAGTPLAGAASPTAWTGTGTGTTTVLSSGTAGPATFSYQYLASCCATGSWNFSTTADFNGTVQLPYNYTGFHAFFEVTASLTAFVERDGATVQSVPLVQAGPTSCDPCTPPSGGFTYTGTTTLTVQSGDTYGFLIGGSNGDSNGTLQGTLTVGPFLSTTATASVALGGTIGDSATLTHTTGGAGGTLTFTAYSNSACTMPVHTSTVPVTGDGTYADPGFAPVSSGTYFWTASYTGDPSTVTLGANDACGAVNESSIVAPPGNDDWPGAQQIPLDDNGNGSATGALDTSGEASWYRFNVAPGENLDVDLTNLPANYDLTLFSDIGQAFNTLNDTSDLQQLSAEFAPSAFSPSAFSPSAFSPSAFSPSAFSPSAFSPSAFSPSAFSPSAFSPSAFSPSAFSPSAFSGFTDTNGTYESAQTRSAIAFSAVDGTADEHIVANTWNNTGSFYIRVTGRNGAYDPGVPFTVNVHEDTNSCSNVVPAAATTVTPAIPAGAKTLILADYERMPDATPADQAALTAMEAKLGTFATKVGGQIVDLGSQSAQVEQLYSQSDANPGCVYAENLTAQAIQGIIASYRAQNPSLQYVVLVGNDHELPFFRYPDASGLGTESNYIPPVADDTTSQASLRLNYILSQDAYGADTTLHLNGLDLPVPDLPVGRLVETPTEISGMLDAYLTGTTNGTVTPTSSLVTGYDFLAGAATQVQTDFSAEFGANADSLISPQGLALDQSWTADDLRTKLLGKPHGLIFLAGHFSADNTLAADYATTMNSTELAASNVNLENSIVFSAGCHSGYNIVDGDAIPSVTQPLDWVQAFAQKQATVIAGTGYQYGDTDFVAYSAKLYASFAQNLTSGSTAVGPALVEAKQAYLDDTTELNGIDVKSLLEATLYGLPMLGVQMPGAAGSSGGGNPGTQAPVSPTPVGNDPGHGLGLSVFEKDFPTPTMTPPPTSLNGGTVSATHLEGPDGVVTAPGEPALPLLSTDVTAAGQVLRGVGFLGGSFTDQTGITPLTGDPATDLDGIHTAFTSSTFFPEKPWAVNYFAGLANGSTDTRLLLTPVQYESDAPGSLTDLQRTFSDLHLRLFYSANVTQAALAAPPTIARVDATSDGSGRVTFAVHVVGDPSAGIQDTWVTYASPTSGGAGQWQSLDLTQDGTDTTLWTGTLQTTGPIVFMVQAVNGVGLVSLDDNGGAFYEPGQIAAALQTGSGLSATNVALNAPSSATAGSQVALSATVTLAAGGPVPDGEQVTFSIGNASRTVLTTGGNGTATVKLSLADPAEATDVTASLAGDAALASSAASAPFTILSLPSTLSLAGTGNSVLDGANTGVSATLTSAGSGLPQKTIEFVLTPTGGGSPIIQTRFTDPSGVAALGSVQQPLGGSYAVSAYFGPGGPKPPTLAVDPIYSASSASGTVLAIAPATVTSIVRAGATPTNASTVSWTVTFNESVSGVSAANFAFAAGAGLTGAGGIQVAGSGTTYTVSAKTGAGSGTLRLDFTSAHGITDSLGAAAGGTLQGQSYTIDTIAPTITFVGNSGAYGLLDQVKITCTASPGSGTPLARNPCTGFSINQPAWAFSPGKNTVPTPGLLATDQAGNSTLPATTSFTVTATTSTLCQLTIQFAEGSAKYAALNATQKKVVNALANGLCTTVTAIVPKLSPTAKAQLVNAYKSGVQSLATQGWLTSSQAATLTTFVATL